MSPSSAPARRVLEAYTARFGGAPDLLVRAPGRVALLGAHVDYSDGWVMPAAIEQAIYLAARATPGRRLRLLALDANQEREVDLDAAPPPVPERDTEMEWSDLPTGLARALEEEGPALPGLDVVYGGDLPAGAGVSSSAAVAVAFAVTWRRLGGLGHDDLALAAACRRMENGYLGVQSGIMDPFASLFGRSGHAVFLDCRSLEHELVPLPGDVAVVVFDSGVRRRLVQSGFNDRRGECRQAVERLRPHLPGIETLRDVSDKDFERHSHHLPLVLRHRVRHAVEEMARVRAGAGALRRRELATFGALMRRSHLSSRDFYEVSIPELDLLAASAWPEAGCHGARMMGGGFGGCVAALVEKAAAETVAEAVATAFERGFDRRPPYFITSLAPGASILESP